MPTAEAVKPITPVRFSHVAFPWLRIVGPAPDTAQRDPKTGIADPASRPEIHFTAGRYTATKQWEIDELRKRPDVYEDDSATALGPCALCGFSTYSSRAFNEHVKKHQE